MKISRVHHCFAQELFEIRPKECRCRKLIERAEAMSAVEAGTAFRLIVKRVNNGRTELYPCNVCEGVLQLVGSCFACSGLGVTKEVVLDEIFHPTDIVVGSTRDAFQCKGYGVVYHANAAVINNLPRAVTIEKSHIERAYVSGREEESVRIDLYGEMNAKELQNLIRVY